MFEYIDRYRKLKGKKWLGVAGTDFNQYTANFVSGTFDSRQALYGI